MQICHFPICTALILLLLLYISIIILWQCNIYKYIKYTKHTARARAGTFPILGLLLLLWRAQPAVWVTGKRKTSARGSPYFLGVSPALRALATHPKVEVRHMRLVCSTQSPSMCATSAKFSRCTYFSPKNPSDPKFSQKFIIFYF